MNIDDKTRDEKLQHDSNRETEKISKLSSRKIDKYEYLTGKEIIPSDQRRMIEQAKFVYSPLEKAFEKQEKLKIKENHVESLKVLTPEENKEETKSFERLFPKGKRTNQIKNEIDEIEKQEENFRRLYKANKYKYDFQQYETIKSFGDSICNGKITIQEAEIDQSSMLDSLTDFVDRSRPKAAESKRKKEILIEVNMLFMKAEN